MDPADIREVGLDRGMCFGTCPAYSVVLRSDGTAEWEGRAHVDRIGPHAGRIDGKAFARLAKAVMRSGFFDWRDNYSAPVTDNPEYRLRVRTTEVEKTVRQYATEEPPGFGPLAELVDDAVDAVGWVAE
jgi:hypothetical protein